MNGLVYYAVPAFVVLILAEAALAWRRQAQVFERRDTAACLTMGVGNVVIAAAVKTAVLGVAFVVYEWRIFDIPSNQWWAWVLLFLLEDLCYYVFHRVHHESRIGWAAHVNHHSSERYNLAVALRQSWTTPFTKPLFWMPLYLLGFHPLMVVVMQGVSLLYQFWIHTQFIGRLGPLEWVFNTPSHHRVHHGSNPEYIDKNYAGILIIWDRLFGTFEPERAPVKYGLTKNINSFNPITIAFHEWRAIGRDMRSSATWNIALQYLFRHPGWQPNNHAAHGQANPQGHRE